MAPHPADCVLNLLFEAGDKLAIGVDESLLGFYLGDDGLLGLERRKRDTESQYLSFGDCLPSSTDLHSHNVLLEVITCHETCEIGGR